ncbi:MAG: hypothetical protein AVDCRST_MAG79-336, partial [uncultured Thermoleophilia bacterium]
MDARSQAVLELPEIRVSLARETGFEGGRVLAETLEPSPDPVVVAGRQSDTAEAIGLLERRAAPRTTGAHDVRGAARRAARGGVLL